ETNALRVGPGEALLAREMVTGPVHWQACEPPRAGETVEAQIRYRGPPVDARLCPRDGSDFSRGAPVILEGPVRAVTPGQSAVFYHGDRLLGGATIDRAAGQGTPFQGR